ncbi:MAG: hypothetical protein LBE12_16380 [Planctomycetaceae bacterium]|jgi:hypothetical protein|nr:hypothetical protein [Planctomycetaceae bacterium]
MLKKISCIILVLLGYFLVFPSLGYAQGQVSRTAPNDPVIHPLTIGHSGALKGKFKFTVGSDGIMIRIDDLSESGSSWTGTGLATSIATFVGTPNSGSVGTFVPNFSGRVRYVPAPGPSGPLPEYEWTAKASYKLNAKFNIVLDFTPGDDFDGRSKTAMGVGEIADIQVVPVNPPDATINITSITTSGKILRGMGIRVTADNTAGPGTITVKATVNGSSTEYTETLSVTVLEPIGLVFFARPGTGIKHIKGIASVGRKLQWQLTPTNVSFYKVQTQEWGTNSNGTSEYQFTGFLQEDHPLIHNPGSWIKLQKCKDTINNPLYRKANITSHEDVCATIKPIPLDNNGNSALSQGGGYSLTLPWRYRVDDTGNPQILKTVISTATIEQNGRTTGNKDGVIFSKNLNDPDSDY